MFNLLIFIKSLNVLQSPTCRLVDSNSILAFVQSRIQRKIFEIQLSYYFKDITMQMT